MTVHLCYPSLEYLYNLIVSTRLLLTVIANLATAIVGFHAGLDPAGCWVACLDHALSRPANFKKSRTLFTHDESIAIVGFHAGLDPVGCWVSCLDPA